MTTLVRLIALLCAFAVANARADDLFTKRPAFSPAEVPARESARCDQIRAMSEGIGEPDERIDLSVDGPPDRGPDRRRPVVLVVCNLPDVRVMCVTYQSNDMKPGDKVVIKGAYRRVDPNHALLDPCLASPLDGSETNPASPAK